MKPADLDLLQSYLDGAATDADAAALDARLKSEPDLADALVRLAHDDAILREWAQVEAAPTTEPARLRSRPYRRIAALAGLAAAIALTIGLLPGPGGSVARLVEVQGDVRVRGGGADWPARSGEALFAGQFVRTVGPDSMAVVRYGDTTRLELGSDTQIHLDQAARHVYLSEGVVMADVAAEPRGGPLVWKTPHAEGFGLGNRFLFSSVSDATVVEANAGDLRVTRTSDGRSIAVPAGSYAVARPRAEPFASHSLPERLSSSRFVIPEAAVSVAYSPDGRWLATGGADGSVKLWDPRDGRPAVTAPPAKKAVRTLRFSPDCRYGAYIADERTVRLWDVTDEGSSASLTRPSIRGEVLAFAFAGNGQSLVTLARVRDGTEIQRWDVATLEATAPVGYVGRLTCVAHDPESRTFAVAGADGFVTVLTGDGVVRKAWPAGQREIRAIAFSPDGAQIATAGNDTTIKLWDAVSGEEQGTLLGHIRPVLAVAYSPDGTTIASAGDGTVKLWDVATGTERTTIRGPRHPVVAIAYSPDGRRLATAGGDKTVRVWDLVR